MKNMLQWALAKDISLADVPAIAISTTGLDKDATLIGVTYLKAGEHEPTDLLITGSIPFEVMGVAHITGIPAELYARASILPRPACDQFETALGRAPMLVCANAGFCMRFLAELGLTCPPLFDVQLGYAMLESDFARDFDFDSPRQLTEALMAADAGRRMTKRTVDSLMSLNGLDIPDGRRTLAAKRCLQLRKLWATLILAM